ncbi:MAG: hypothetical protein GY757_56805 [bacterium]|nr:hypothetical protein [bacterium]
MTLILDTYIDNYLQQAQPCDKKVARHLKEIIPVTTHMSKSLFSKIIKALKKEIDNGKNFKAAFLEVCDKFVLTGDIIETELPGLLSRIILNEIKFIEKIAKERSIPLDREEIKTIIDSKDRNDIMDLLGNLKLSLRDVVFATFDEKNPEADPFRNYCLKDIVNMLALDDRSKFKEKHPMTAVCLRYINRDDMINRYPAFPDAGWNDKFYPSEEDDKFGRTRSLDPSLINMPEIVHENLDMADVIEEIRFIEE